jgi:hypothetical protein
MTLPVIDLTTTRLTERESTWLHAFPLGTYQHPIHGALTFTRQRLQRIADGVNLGLRGVALALDYDHREDRAKGGKAAGWIERAEVRGDGLWIAVRLTAEALAEVRAGAWRYLSPEFGDWTDPRTGLRHVDVLAGAALTNRPFLRGLATVAASEGASHTPRPTAPLMGMGFGGGGCGESTRAAPPPTPGNRPTSLAELESLTRFMAVLGDHLGAATFHEALERASLEDPQGYAAYRQSTYVDGRREGW